MHLMLNRTGYCEQDGKGRSNIYLQSVYITKQCPSINAAESSETSDIITSETERDEIQMHALK